MTCPPNQIGIASYRATMEVSKLMTPSEMSPRHRKQLRSVRTRWDLARLDGTTLASDRWDDTCDALVHAVLTGRAVETALRGYGAGRHSLDLSLTETMEDLADLAWALPARHRRQLDSLEAAIAVAAGWNEAARS